MSHDHGHSHSHAPPDSLTKAFAIGIVLNIAFVILGVAAGLFAHSTALLADAAHNLGDVLGLGMAWGAMVLAKRATTARRTYGLRRTTILAALANGGLVLFAIGGVVWEAVQRLGDAHAVDGGIVAIVAAIGVALNGVSAMLFAKGREKDMNQRGAFLHLVADAAVSAGVVVAGLVVWKTGWVWIDPVTSILVSIVILRGTWKLVREAFDLLIDAVPGHIDPDAVDAYLRGLPDVLEVHDLHVWSMSTTEVALTAHLVLPWPTAQPAFLATIKHDLEHRFGVHHITLQFEDCVGGNCAQASVGSL
ncbi:MAG TPA: cation diffusion facilitator family transporter [Kofleriaceae bacterium]|jgi:cobalt-zinc-cadmium efflux system protein